ncbi:UvrD-helicase domain-containing protein, partial [Campylobacter coli]
MQENELNKYDFILLDEAQDTNEVMLNVFLNNNCSKILVGDTFQNIYGFNKTINALEILDTNYECNLSTSF